MYFSILWSVRECTFLLFVWNDQNSFPLFERGANVRSSVHFRREHDSGLFLLAVRGCAFLLCKNKNTGRIQVHDLNADVFDSVCPSMD